MPDPAFDRSGIPAIGDGEYLQEVDGREVRAANTGVPHAVIFVEEVDAIDVEALAPAIRRDPSFPEGANVNFVEVTGPDAIRVRTFERGVEGETLSCGTGATASAAIAHRLGLVGATVEVETTGRSPDDRARELDDPDRAGRDGLLGRHHALTLIFHGRGAPRRRAAPVREGHVAPGRVRLTRSASPPPSAPGPSRASP